MDRSKLSREALRALQAKEHADKYHRIALWLGLNSLKALVPFSGERIREALAAGDEHLNTLSLASWDKQHGNPPGTEGADRGPCPCCKQPLPPLDKSVGVWGLLRAAIARDERAGRVPLLRSWSQSDTVSTLKHVARYHVGGPILGCVCGEDLYTPQQAEQHLKENDHTGQPEPYVKPLGPSLKYARPWIKAKPFKGVR